MKAKGPILLLITALLWGLAFVAQTSAADSVEPLTFIASRNIIGVLFLTGVIEVRKRLGQDEPPTSANTASRATGTTAAGGSAGYSRRTLWVAGILCGVVLWASAFLQQWGITSYPPEAAASSRSGFLTATYMVMVAVIGTIAGKKTQPIVIVAVVVAMVGMYFLCCPNGFSNIYFGDWLTLACALGYALHILVIDRYTQVDGVRLSRIQLLTSFAIAFVGALLFEHPTPAIVLAAAVPILYAGICSDGIAYTCQIIAQKTTDPTVASILMSLESVFAALGGWLILSESLSGIELFGCVLVFAAVMLAQVPDFVQNALEKKQKS